MEGFFFIAPIIGLVALLCAAWFSTWINKNSMGNDRMKEIASYIREGAMAFLMREYRTVAIFIVVMFLLLLFLPGLGLPIAVTFLMGACFSILAGFFGMRTATAANVRTAAAAQSKGMSHALKVAFRSGAVMGLCVVGLGLFGVGILAAVLGLDNANLLTGFGLGASSIALFGRVGGGIYTKAADVGADLVGKVEAGIPEDDPRNPAVIADNVGDNVGDVAGMGSDLFESYVGAIISAITLAVTITEVDPLSGSLFPLLLSGIGILACIVSVFTVGAGETANPAKSLNMSTYISAAISLVAAFVLSRYLFGNLNAFIAVAIGLVIGTAIGTLTEYYTS